MFKEVLAPGQAAPFDVFVEDDNAVIDSYKTSVDASVTGSDPIDSSNDLEILSDNWNTDSIGYTHVVGEVKNTADRKVTFAQAVATFYDEEGTVVGADFTFTDPEDIPPGETAPFEVISGDENENYASYEVFVDAEAYQ